MDRGQALLAAAALRMGLLLLGLHVGFLRGLDVSIIRRPLQLTLPQSPLTKTLQHARLACTGVLLGYALEKHDAANIQEAHPRRTASLSGLQGV